MLDTRLQSSVMERQKDTMDREYEQQFQECVDIASRNPADLRIGRRISDLRDLDRRRHRQHRTQKAMNSVDNALQTEHDTKTLERAVHKANRVLKANRGTGSHKTLETVKQFAQGAQAQGNQRGLIDDAMSLARDAIQENDDVQMQNEQEEDELAQTTNLLNLVHERANLQRSKQLPDPPSRALSSTTTMTQVDDSFSRVVDHRPVQLVSTQVDDAHVRRPRVVSSPSSSSSSSLQPGSFPRTDRRMLSSTPMSSTSRDKTLSMHTRQPETKRQRVYRTSNGNGQDDDNDAVKEWVERGYPDSMPVVTSMMSSANNRHRPPLANTVHANDAVTPARSTRESRPIQRHASSQDEVDDDDTDTTH
jgi:hypothetical protein